MKQSRSYKKSAIKKIWIAAAIISASTILLEFFITLHPHFKIEAVFAFHALYGFFACVAMVIFAKLLGYLIKRRDDYYDL